MLSRNRRLETILIVGALVLLTLPGFAVAQPLPGGTLDPLTIPKFTTSLVIPPVMPDSGVSPKDGRPYYEIAVRQLRQQILPSPLPMTTVWGYGSRNHASTFNYPAFTVEVQAHTPVWVKWINDLKDPVTGHFLPHLLPVDQTLHWANPPQQCRDGSTRTDCEGDNPNPYTGPVPIVTHVHGSHVDPHSDGYPEAWWLPAATDIPAGYATKGRLYDQADPANAEPGTALFRYRNDQEPTTLWFHDHTLGMTRNNVYAGPAGFWLIRGAGEPAGLPGPAPRPGDPAGTKYFEIPIAIQDRSFNDNGSLFYPGDRAFFEGLFPEELSIDFAPGSDVPPIWNPEAFFNTMVVNGRTWPYLEVEPRRYRFRLLNGCNSRFLNLSLWEVLAEDPNTRAVTSFGRELPFYQIGAEEGYLPKVVKILTGFSAALTPGQDEPEPLDPAPDPYTPEPLRGLLMGLAERADVIVDFTGLEPGTVIRLINTGPDEPFGGFPVTPADNTTTAQAMEFRVVSLSGTDTTTPPKDLVLAPVPALVPTNPDPRKLSLNEEESMTTCVVVNPDGSITELPGVSPGPECTAAGGMAFGPVAALLGTVDSLGNGVPLRWMEPITENPRLDEIETWEIFNFTADAHPIHLHLVKFQVVDRQALTTDGEGMAIQPAELVGSPEPPEPTEAGYKDTVIAYPGQVTRIRAKFDIAGLYVWHCHIVEHEDNEMMRPYVVRYRDDLNGDGKVDRTDLAILLAKIRERSPLPGILAYDLNGDGKVDLLDARYLSLRFTP